MDASSEVEAHTNYRKKTVSTVLSTMSDTNISYVLRSSKNIDIVDQNWMCDSLSDDGKKNVSFSEISAV